MKAMILAAGLGTRLGKITETQPKALVPVRGVPIIARVVKQLKMAGVTGVAINLHHFADQIKTYFKAQQNFGIEVYFSEEKELLDTGGGLYKARDFFADQETILVHNADVYTDINLKDLYQTQQNSNSNCLATLLVRKKSSGRVLLFDEQGLSGWANTKTAEQQQLRDLKSAQPVGFCGVQALATKLLDFAPKDTACFRLMSLFLQAVSDGNRIQPYYLKEKHWFDMGSPERLEQLEEFLNIDQ